MVDAAHSGKEHREAHKSQLLRLAEDAPRALLKGLDHDAGDLVRDGGADGGVEGVGELEADDEVNLGGGVVCVLTEGPQLPARDERGEDGAAAVGAAAASASRGGGGRGGRSPPGGRLEVGAADGLDGAVGAAAQAAGEGLLEAAPADAQVGLGRGVGGAGVAGGYARL